MARRILTHREQVEMTAPWRVAAGEYQHISDKYDAKPYTPGEDDPDLWMSPEDVLRHADPDNDTYPEGIAKHKQRIVERGGMRHPIAIATDGNQAYVEDGHHRAMAAQQLGMDRVPVKITPTTFHPQYSRNMPQAQDVLRTWWNGSRHHTAGAQGELPELSHEYQVVDPGKWKELHVLRGWHGDNLAGELTWNRGGQVQSIQSFDPYPRKGVATSLWNHARTNINPDIHHADNVSDDGAAWIKSLPKEAGARGPTPPLTFEPFDTLWSNGIMARHAHDNRPVGHLHWHPDGEIDTIQTHPDFQRQGIGSAMLKHAVENPDTYESTWPIRASNHMTSAGRAFAQSHGHNPSDDEVTPADEDVNDWGWTAVKNYVPAHVPYTGQNEAEMAEHLTPGFHQRGVVARRRIGGVLGAWPKKWRGHEPEGVEWDKTWSPNHPDHQGQPWGNNA